MRRRSSDQLTVRAVTFPTTSANFSSLKTSLGMALAWSNPYSFWLHVLSHASTPKHTRVESNKPIFVLQVPRGSEWKVNWTEARAKQCDGADNCCGHRIKHRVHFVLNTDIDFLLSYSPVHPLSTQLTRWLTVWRVTVTLMWWRASTKRLAPSAVCPVQLLKLPFGPIHIH